MFKKYFYITLATLSFILLLCDIQTNEYYMIKIIALKLLAGGILLFSVAKLKPYIDEEDEIDVSFRDD